MPVSFINIPKNIGGNLRNDMEGFCTAELTALHWGVSRKQEPKVTIEFVVTSDIPGLDSTMGEKVLEACSLQPQALWKLNNYYAQVKGEDFPEGDMTYDEFKQLCEQTLIGTQWNMDLIVGVDDRNQPRTQVQKAEIR